MHADQSFEFQKCDLLCTCGQVNLDCFDQVVDCLILSVESVRQDFMKQSDFKGDLGRVEMFSVQHELDDLASVVF